MGRKNRKKKAHRAWKRRAARVQREKRLNQLGEVRTTPPEPEPAPTPIEHRQSARKTDLAREAKRKDVFHLLGLGLSTRQIGERVGVSRQTVSTWAAESGEGLRQQYLQTAQNRRRDVLKLHSEGLSGKEISSRLEVSESLVSLRLIEELGKGGRKTAKPDTNEASEDNPLVRYQPELF